MPISKIKQAILRFGLTALSFLLLVLLSAAVEGTLALPVAFGVGVPAKAVSRAQRKAARRSPAPVHLQVVTGSHAA